LKAAQVRRVLVAEEALADPTGGVSKPGIGLLRRERTGSRRPIRSSRV